MKVISIINQKGGVGKSTTAQALASGLSLKGYKTLLIDIDAQGNTSDTYRASKDGATILGVLLEEVKPDEAIQHTAYGDIIASSESLTGADSFISETGKEYKLKEALEKIRSKYDYIIIDTPPALGILTINALTASDRVIIPAQADKYSFDGIQRLWKSIQPVKKYCNPGLKIDGVLLTMYEGRQILSKNLQESTEELAERLQTKVYKTTIRRAVAVREAQVMGESLYSYAPREKVTEDYRAFIEEFLKGDKSNG